MRCGISNALAKNNAVHYQIIPCQQPEQIWHMAITQPIFGY